MLNGRYESCGGFGEFLWSCSPVFLPAVYILHSNVHKSIDSFVMQLLAAAFLQLLSALPLY